MTISTSHNKVIILYQIRLFFFKKKLMFFRVILCKNPNFCSHKRQNKFKKKFFLWDSNLKKFSLKT